MTDSVTSSVADTRRLATTMLWGGGWTGAITSAVAVVVALLWQGSSGAIGALIGAVIALGAGAVAPTILRAFAAANPLVIMGLVMLGFFTKLLVFLVLILVFGDTTLFDRRSFGFTVLAVTVAWTAGEIIAFLRARVPVVATVRSEPDEEDSPDSSSGDDTFGGSQPPPQGRELRQPPS